MGIPSYFANVVKYHKQIIKKLGLLPIVHNLYMDTNGLVYDAVRIIGSNQGMSNDDYESAIIEMVCQKITAYIELVKPKSQVFIAFDGVAPVAKLNQQRERRYKSWFTTIVEQSINATSAAATTAAHRESGDSQYDREQKAKTINKTVHKAWNTSSITPGTQFMTKLNAQMRLFIDTQVRVQSTTGVTPIHFIYSGSDEPGEGEHKLFEYIRNNPKYHKDTTTLIYGLDADLIMLCLNHLHVSENIYLYRDTPDFIQSLDSNLSKDDNYFLDIPTFACSLERLMRETKETGVAPEMSFVAPNTDAKLSVSTNKITPQVIAAIDDYILMTFMLGNDFMPHFPSINLRTTGMNVLLQTYAHIFRSSGAYLVKRASSKRSGGSSEGQIKTIDWKQMRAFIDCLASNEHQRLIDEHKLRDRQSKRFVSNNNHSHSDANRNAGQKQPMDSKCKESSGVDLTELTGIACEKITELVSSNNTMADFMSIPMKERSIEKYIDPFRENWEFRYYDSLFDVDIFEGNGNPKENNRIRQICVNYMEGLEWTMQYYSSGCIDWRWCYKYAYAPLLTDLLRFIPYMDVTMIEEKPKSPVRDLVQLCYVLPMASHNLLPLKLAEKLKREYSHFYCDKLEFKWAYCKYFWEAHTELPHIRIQELEQVVAV